MTKVGTGFDDAHARDDLDAARSRSRAPTSPFDVGTPDRPRPPLGRAAARVRGALHRVDARTAASATRPSSGCATTRSPRSAGARSRSRSDRRADADPPRRTSAERATASAAAERRRAPAAPAARRAARVKLTNLKKVFWPDEGYTKGDLIALLRRGRAAACCPTCATARWCSRAIPTASRASRSSRRTRRCSRRTGCAPSGLLAGRRARHPLLRASTTPRSLRYVANLRHDPDPPVERRGSGSLERPDWLVLDLDPKGAPFTDVVQVARALAPHPRRAGAAELRRRPRARPGCTS